MSKSQRRAKAAKRITSKRPTPRPALCWPVVLRLFTEWLMDSGWTTDASEAYSTAMAVDRSARDRNIVVTGVDVPLELFEHDLYADDCGHTPWSPDALIDAVDLFARFIVGERISPTQEADIAELVVLDPLVPPLLASVPCRHPAHLGPITLTSHVARIAAWCEDNGSVPRPCFEHSRTSKQIRDALDRPNAERDVTDELLSQARYQVVIAAALGADVLLGDNRALRAGDHVEHWLREPAEEHRRRCLVAAYVACSEPIFRLNDESMQREMAVASAALWFLLVRALVDDAAHDGEPLPTGTDTDPKRVSAWLSVRIAIMVDLGLIIPVNGKMCVPDSHASALVEALDRRRAGNAAP